MSRKNNFKNSSTDDPDSKKSPMVFYNSIPTEELLKEKEDTRRAKSVRPHHPTTPERQMWLWAGVAIVMAVLIFFWARNIPTMLKTESSDQASQSLFEKSKKDLSSLFTEQRQAAEDIKTTLLNAANKLASSGLAAISTSSTEKTLTPEQLQEVANKLKTNTKK